MLWASVGFSAAVVGEGRPGAREEVFKLVDEYYNNDDEMINMVSDVIKLAIDSAATEDVISGSDNDAIVCDSKSPIVHYCWSGGEVIIDKLKSKNTCP